MTTEITIQVPASLGDALARERDRLPELLALSLTQPALPARVYRDIVAFLASHPTPAQIAAWGPAPDVRARLARLLERSAAGSLTPVEAAELDEFAQIEHLVVLIKTGHLSLLAPTS